MPGGGLACGDVPGEPEANDRDSLSTHERKRLGPRLCGHDCRTQFLFSGVSDSSFGMPERNAASSREMQEIARLGPSDEGQLRISHARSVSPNTDRSGVPRFKALTSRCMHDDQRLGPRLRGQDRFTHACCSCGRAESPASGDCAVADDGSNMTAPMMSARLRKSEVGI